MDISRRPTLRALATEVGVLGLNDPHAYQKTREDLLALLQPKFPGIEDMEELEVKDLLLEEKEKNAKGGSKDSKGNEN